MFPSLGWDQAKSLSITGGKFVRHFAGDAFSFLVGIMFLLLFLAFLLFLICAGIRFEELFPETE